MNLLLGVSNIVGLSYSMNAPVMVNLEGETDPLEVPSYTRLIFIRGFTLTAHVLLICALRCSCDILFPMHRNWL